MTHDHPSFNGCFQIFTWDILGTMVGNHQTSLVVMGPGVETAGKLLFFAKSWRRVCPCACDHFVSWEGYVKDKTSRFWMASSFCS